MDLGIILFFAALVTFGIWNASSGNDIEEHRDDPYLTYGYLVTPANTLAWALISLVVPIAVGAAIWFRYGYTTAIYACSMLIPAASWACLKMIRRTTRLPIDIMAALVWLENYRTTQRTTSFARVARGGGLFAGVHWTDVAAGIDTRGLLINFDHRTYLLPWDSGIRLAETKFKPPSAAEHVPCLSLSFPAAVDVKLLFACSEDNIRFALDQVYPPKDQLAETP